MTESQGAGPRTRIASIDILRGLVIVLMVLDHVRDFLHESGWAVNPLDPAQTTPLLYATRWATHFCAPTFVLLSGVSAWLQLGQGKSKRELSIFLLTRGLWLVFLEFTVIGFAWSFSIPFLVFLQVIWAIGVSMIALAALVWLPRVAVLGIGAAIILGHNLLDGVRSDQFGAFAIGWMALHEQNVVFAGDRPVALIAYPVLAWIGVMAFGFGIGAVFEMEPARRNRALLMLGGGMFAAFLVLRGFNFYGDPSPWKAGADLTASVMTFFNVQKYPPSLLFVCATLGLVIFAIPWIETWRGPIGRFFKTFGAVPMFAYVVHIFIVHAAAFAIHAAAGHDVDGLINNMFNIIFRPQMFEGAGLPLWIVYAAWGGVLAILYPLCRWWGEVKRKRRDWWMSYL